MVEAPGHDAAERLAVHSEVVLRRRLDVPVPGELLDVRDVRGVWSRFVQYVWCRMCGVNGLSMPARGLSSAKYLDMSLWSSLRGMPVVTNTAGWSSTRRYRSLLTHCRVPSGQKTARRLPPLLVISNSSSPARTAGSS